MRRAALAVVCLLVLSGSLSGGGVAEASFPGKNGRLVFTDYVFDDGGGWREVFTMNRDGTDRVRLTFDGGDYFFAEGEEFASENRGPAWSPTGDAIAYVHWDRTGYEVRLMDPEGAPLGMVTEQFDQVSAMTWSPEGQELAVITRTGSDPHNEVWIVDVKTGAGRSVVGHPSDVGLLSIGYEIEWSPKGDVIAVEGWAPGGGLIGIHLVTADGEYVKQVACGGHAAEDPEWAPSGHTLYCSASYDYFDNPIPGYTPIWPSEAELWSVNVSDNTTDRLARIADNPIYRPAASPDGTDLMFYADDYLWSANPLRRATRGLGFGLDWQPRQGSFWDDEQSVFTSDIDWMADAGITKGCNPPANDRFCPDSHVTRGQMAAFLVRALDLPAAPSAGFTDTVGTTFEKDIDKLAAAGITKGCNPPDNDRFCPDDKVRREVMAAFLVRAMKYTDDGGGDLFTDDDGSIFETDIDKLATAGVTKGCNPPTNDRFCPTQNVTRGQMAAFLHRALG